MRTCIISQLTDTEIVSRTRGLPSLWCKLRLLVFCFRFLSNNKLTNLTRESFHNIKTLKYLWVHSVWFVLNGNERFALFSNPTKIFCCHSRFSQCLGCHFLCACVRPVEPSVNRRWLVYVYFFVVALVCIKTANVALKVTQLLWLRQIFEWQFDQVPGFIYF